MAFQPVPGICKVSLEYLHLGQVNVNTLHFEKEGVIDVLGMTELAEGLEDWEAEFRQPRRSSFSSLTRIVVTDLSTAFAPVVDYAPETPLVGADAAEPLPGSAAAVTTLLTPNRGRSYRGRIYWGQLTTISATGNDITTGYRDAANNAVEALGLLGDALGWHQVVVSRVQDGVVLPLGVGTPVTGWRTSLDIKSQRRRLD